MFGIGPMELAVIAIVALVFVGPQRLPQMMRQIGKFVVYARRYSSDLRHEFNQVVRDAETELRIDEAKKLREEIQAEMQKISEQPTLTGASDSQPPTHESSQTFPNEESSGIEPHALTNQKQFAGFDDAHLESAPGLATSKKDV